MSSSLSDEDIARIHNLLGVFNQVVDQTLVSTGKIGLTQTTLNDAAQDAILHHQSFINKFIHQKSVDPYKIVSWYGFFLSKKADDPKKMILLIALKHMNDLLSKEPLHQKMSDAHIGHLYNMARLDGMEDEFAIGKNGVYSVFSSCVDYLRCYRDACLVTH